MINQLNRSRPWDICVIGGGATGLGIAVDAASRGYDTLLLEKHDFAKGTSSRSTKLVHGGVRYLQQGNIKLVMEALKERGILLRNAPHLVKNQSFILPNYKWWESSFYGIGLKVYDWMAGSLGLGPSRILSREETLSLAPSLAKKDLRGGVEYHDGQFDDSRLAIHLAMTAADHGATVLNYFPVTGFLKKNDRITGVKAKDEISGNDYEIPALAVINATGVFTDDIMKLDDPRAEKILSLSQGIHLVFDRSFLPGESAIIIPRTNDKRVLFAVPWQGHVVAGTTDTPIKKTSEEPEALKDEIGFVLDHLGHYLDKDPRKKDIKAVFAGLRPLVRGKSRKTAALSRDHLVTVSDSDLITVTGGKWTTYRKMAEDVVEVAIVKANLDQRPCKTETLAIHGAMETAGTSHLDQYGKDKTAILELASADPSLAEKIHPAHDYIKAEIAWAVKEEMCETLEDALARRTRLLFLDARAAREAAPEVANLMTSILNKSADWGKEQVDLFNKLAVSYLPNP